MRANHQVQSQMLSDFVLEIRYHAIGRFLDRQGSWADDISGALKLPIWTLNREILEAHSDTLGEKAFVGLKRSGFHCIDAAAQNYFIDRGSKLLHAIFSLDSFPSILQVERIGVRSRFFYGFDGDFAELRTRYCQRFLVLSQAATDAISGEFVDIGGHLDFKDSDGNFNTMSGPMRAEQAREILQRPRDSSIPEVGLFYDIDYWKQSLGEQHMDQLLTFLSRTATAAWERAERIRKLVLAEGQ